MEIEAVLNVAIPALIVMFFLGLFYVKLKEPVDLFLAWIGRGIKGIFLRGREVSESIVVEDVITYI